MVKRSRMAMFCTTRITSNQETYHGVQKYEAHTVTHLVRVDGDWSSSETRKNVVATFTDMAIGTCGGNFAFLVKRAANTES